MQKRPKFWTKNALFRYFWAGVWKSYCHIWNQRPWVTLIMTFRKKKFRFGTKNPLFGYFWARIWKNYCHIRNQHPRVSLTATFRKKKAMSKFGTKNALFGYFWATISFIIFWNFSMFYQMFLSPQEKRWSIIIYKHGINKFSHKLPNDLRLRKYKESV